ncbi:hypothetical protein RRG08_061294 [Elysia crispata]|uniref:ATP-dependent DNA helicase n=1 Tax=Elysia crispata TaxID=231223 RepID=A0AAE0YGN5_9GAST|nr:hypothetical protein RRG08_061294 [Elysia crispata]
MVLTRHTTLTVTQTAGSLSKFLTRYCQVLVQVNTSLLTGGIPLGLLWITSPAITCTTLEQYRQTGKNFPPELKIQKLQHMESKAYKTADDKILWQLFIDIKKYAAEAGLGDNVFAPPEIGKARPGRPAEPLLLDQFTYNSYLVVWSPHDTRCAYCSRLDAPKRTGLICVGWAINDDNTLADAAATNMPVQLRQLFAIMLHTCDLSQPMQLWEKHKDSLCEDFRHIAELMDGPVFNSDLIYNNALIIIEDIVLNMGGNHLSFFGIPEPRHQEQNGFVQGLFRERNYNVAELTESIETNVPRLVADQRYAFDRIMSTVHEGRGGIFFLDAPGGTGKTFILNLLFARVRMDNKIALAVASSGIAATLLKGERTAHSTFKIPINLMATDSPTCGIKRGTDQGNLLKETELTVWDEATMSHKRALEAVDRSNAPRYQEK